MTKNEIAVKLGYTDANQLELNIESYGEPLNKWWGVMQELIAKLNKPVVIKSVCDDFFPSFDKPNTCLHCGFFKHEHS